MRHQHELQHAGPLEISTAHCTGMATFDAQIWGTKLNEDESLVPGWKRLPQAAKPMQQLARFVRAITSLEDSVGDPKPRASDGATGTNAGNSQWHSEDHVRGCSCYTSPCISH